jgi:hypothetical protein
MSTPTKLRDLLTDVEKTAEVSPWGPNWNPAKKHIQHISFEIGPCLINYTYNPEEQTCTCETVDIDTGETVGAQIFSNVSPTLWARITDKFCVYDNSEDCEADWSDY